MNLDKSAINFQKTSIKLVRSSVGALRKVFLAIIMKLQQNYWFIRTTLTLAKYLSAIFIILLESSCKEICTLSYIYIEENQHGSFGFSEESK